MKITIKAALEMLQAIQQLDSYQNGADKPTLYRYDGGTRLQIAAARRKLRAISDDYNDARNSMLLQVTNGAGHLPTIDFGAEQGERKRTVEQHVEFNSRDRELLSAIIELDIQPLSVDKFKLDDNPIPPAVLDLLGNFIAT